MNSSKNSLGEGSPGIFVKMWHLIFARISKSMSSPGGSAQTLVVNMLTTDIRKLTKILTLPHFCLFIHTHVEVPK